MSECNTVPPTNSKNDDEVSLLDLFAIIWQRRVFVTVFTILSGVIVFAFAFISIKMPPEKSYLPNKYKATALMMINSSSSSSGNLSKALASSGLSSLAGLMGVSSSGGSSNGQLAVYLITTKSFLDSLAEELNLVERFAIQASDFPKTTLRSFFMEDLKANLTTATGVLELEYTHIDKEFATDVVNCAVRLLEQRFKSLGLDQNLLKKENLENTMHASMTEITSIEREMQELETGIMAARTDSIPRTTAEITRLKRELLIQEAVYSQMRQEYELLKISMSSETPIFQILEYAEVPEKKSEPSRAIICVIGTVAGFFIAIFLCFVSNMIEKIKKDKEAMAKLGFKIKDTRKDEKN